MCLCTLYTGRSGSDTGDRSPRILESRRFGTEFYCRIEKAAEAKVYGSEFDVQLTADGVVVVNHDDAIDGLVIGETAYDKLKDLKLKNGEKLPTLADYLEAGRKLPDVQLILEIKPHKTKAQEDQIAETTVKW